ncbi:MAG: hypothetical protein ACYS3S_14855 [Planctomycetota bacterium]
MDTEKHIEKQETEERRPRIDWNIWDAILLAFIIVYVILVPIGGFHYFCGWYNPYLMFGFVFLIYLPLSVLLLIFTVIWTLRLFINWTKYTQRKKIIKFLQVCIPTVFIASFFVSFLTPIETYFWQPGFKPFTYGFRERIRRKADIEDIRNWLRTLQNENYSSVSIELSRDSDSLKRQWPDSIEWPKSLKVFNPNYVNLNLDENGNPKMSMTWGGVFAHWGVVIGMEDMEIPPSDLNRYGEYRLPLEPGAYVWHELQ